MTVNMTRRAFLRGAAAGVAVMASPALALPVAEAIPCIVGNGIHDDTLGLQAALDGKPFWCADSSTASVFRVNGICHIRNGHFRVSNTLQVHSAHIDSSIFEGPSHEALISFQRGEGDEPTFISNCMLNAGKAT